MGASMRENTNSTSDIRWHDVVILLMFAGALCAMWLGWF
jgi:hypothetical protein